MLAQSANGVALTEGNTPVTGMARTQAALRGRRPVARLGSSMRENREIPCLAGGDGRAGNWRRNESPWSRVPRDGKSGEGDPRNRTRTLTRNDG